MNGIENQENQESGFYYSLSTNFQADSLFGIDNALPTELFFGETPPSSLSPDASQRISPQSTGASNLDDGLRTPEPQSFPSDDYSDNCEMLNHHLVSDVNPSLQVASHVTADLSSIDSDLIDNQCNGTEIGKSYSPRPKDMDITFYSNLECIPEIPGISPLKTLENNTDNPIKSLEELFDDDKDLDNISNESNTVSSEMGLLSSCGDINHQKFLNEAILRLPDHKTDISNSSENCLMNADSISMVNSIPSVDIKKESSADVSNPLEMHQFQVTKTITQQNAVVDNEQSFNNNEVITGSTLDEVSNNSDNVISNSNPTETYLETKDNLACDSSPISKTDDKKVDMQEAAESVDAISAAELAICQMLDAITDPPSQNANSISNDIQTTPETVEYHIVPSTENKCQHQEEFCENSKLHLSVSTTPKNIHEETLLHKPNADISVIPTDITNIKDEKVEYQLPAEDYRTLSSASVVGIVTDKFSKVNNFECYVYLERLDNDYIRKSNTSKKTSRGSSPKKQKINHCPPKCITKDTTTVSSHTIPRRRARCNMYKNRSSKKRKISYYTPDYTSKTPATLPNRSLPRRRYRCSMCKRVYSSLESLEIHKCRKGERANLIATASTSSTVHFVTSPLCNNSAVGIESVQCEQETEHQSVEQAANSDQRNSIYNLDQSYMQMPDVKDTQIIEQYDKDEPPFCCQKCSQVFRDQSLLVQHLCYMHSTQFTKCDVCKLKFDRNTGIRNHMLLHANSKAYCCQLCSFASSFQAGLERHVWAHHTPHDIRVIEGENVTESNVLAKLKSCSVVLEALPISGRLFKWH